MAKGRKRNELNEGILAFDFRSVYPFAKSWQIVYIIPTCMGLVIYQIRIWELDWIQQQGLKIYSLVQTRWFGITSQTNEIITIFSSKLDWINAGLSITICKQDQLKWLANYFSKS